MEANKEQVKVYEYNGHPIIALYLKTYKGKDEYLNLGVKKCKAILDNIDAITKFVKENDSDPSFVEIEQ